MTDDKSKKKPLPTTGTVIRESYLGAKKEEKKPKKNENN